MYTSSIQVRILFLSIYLLYHQSLGQTPIWYANTQDTRRWELVPHDPAVQASSDLYVCRLVDICITWDRKHWFVHTYNIKQHLFIQYRVGEMSILLFGGVNRGRVKRKVWLFDVLGKRMICLPTQKSACWPSPRYNITTCTHSSASCTFE